MENSLGRMKARVVADSGEGGWEMMTEAWRRERDAPDQQKPERRRIGLFHLPRAKERHSRGDSLASGAP